MSVGDSYSKLEGDGSMPEADKLACSLTCTLFKGLRNSSPARLLSWGCTQDDKGYACSLDCIVHRSL